MPFESLISKRRLKIFSNRVFKKVVECSAAGDVGDMMGDVASVKFPQWRGGPSVIVPASIRVRARARVRGRVRVRDRVCS